MSRKQDASMKVLAGAPTEESLPERPLGVQSLLLNGVTAQTLEPVRGY